MLDGLFGRHVGEHALGERFADDDDGLPALAIKRVEIASSNDGNAEGGKKAGRDDAHLRARILFAGGTDVTVCRELQAGTEGAGIPPGSNHAESGLVYAW